MLQSTENLFLVLVRFFDCHWNENGKIEKTITCVSDTDTSDRITG